MPPIGQSTSHSNTRCWSHHQRSKGANLLCLLDVRGLKCFQLRPLTPDQGLCPWTPQGAPPTDPRYRLALRARHVPPKLKFWIRQCRPLWLRNWSYTYQLTAVQAYETTFETTCKTSCAVTSRLLTRELSFQLTPSNFTRRPVFKFH